MNRRDFVRRGALWTLGATIITPELVERLTWRRRFWPGVDIPTGPQYRKAPPGYAFLFDKEALDVWHLMRTSARSAIPTCEWTRPRDFPYSSPEAR